MLNRRTLLRATAIAPALATPHIARANEKLVVISHAVHRTAATTGRGGDITEAWRRANNVEIEWLTFGVEATNERAL